MKYRASDLVKSLSQGFPTFRSLEQTKRRSVPELVSLGLVAALFYLIFALFAVSVWKGPHICSKNLRGRMNKAFLQPSSGRFSTKR